MAESRIPRRIRVDLATEPELAIRRAIGAVEAMECDSRLTDAVVSLGDALAKVSEVTDERLREVSIG